MAVICCVALCCLTLRTHFSFCFLFRHLRSVIYVAAVVFAYWKHRSPLAQLVPAAFLCLWLCTANLGSVALSAFAASAARANSASFPVATALSVLFLCCSRAARAAGRQSASALLCTVGAVCAAVVCRAPSYTAGKELWVGWALLCGVFLHEYTVHMGRQSSTMLLVAGIMQWSALSLTLVTSVDAQLFVAKVAASSLSTSSSSSVAYLCSYTRIPWLAVCGSLLVASFFAQHWRDHVQRRRVFIRDSASHALHAAALIAVVEASQQLMTAAI